MKGHEHQDLLQKLVDETQSLASSDDSSNVVSFQDYFEKRKLAENKQTTSGTLCGKLADSCAEMYRLHYLKSIECFRFSVDGKIMDFPANWSVFCHLLPIIVDRATGNFEVTHANDQDCLLQIFGKHMQWPDSLFFCTDGGEVYLIPLNNSQTELRDWLTQHFFLSFSGKTKRAG